MKLINGQKRKHMKMIQLMMFVFFLLIFFVLINILFLKIINLISYSPCQTLFIIAYVNGQLSIINRLTFDICMK